MSVYSIGPKEIYNCQSNIWGSPFVAPEVDAMCKEDTPASVEKYKNLVLKQGQEAFINGLSYQRNILMMAAKAANVNLVKYIAENGDPKIIDMRNTEGQTALHCAVLSDAPSEKVIACARILIEAGANVNARMTYKDTTNPQDISESNFVGDNALGATIRDLSYVQPREALGCEVNFEETKAHRDAKRKHLELLVQLFLFNGATVAYETGLKYSVTARVDASENSLLGERDRILKEIANRVLSWPQARLLFIGSTDRASPLSDLPSELVNMLFQERLAMKCDQ